MVDVALGTLLIALALGSLYSQTLYGSLTLFFAFGVIMALAWARLQAPDLALAEAAIGAGLSGALLLSALRKSRPEVVREGKLRHPVSASVLSLLVLALLVGSLVPAFEQEPLLPVMVGERLSDSGVAHPVTAVLLNFRAWDTLLELAVLLLALLGIKVLKPTQTPAPRPWPLLLTWAKTLAPIVVVMGGYLLWRGSHAAGGAFQAGALLAAGAVLLRLNHVLPPLRWSNPLVRVAILAGVTVFLSTAAATAWLGTGWLDYPENAGTAIIVAIEIAATLSIATTLTLLVVGEGEELQL
jgi:multisubunit Na+/H+ antiporter MnhB subunit